VSTVSRFCCEFSLGRQKRVTCEIKRALLVGDRASRAFKEQAPGPRRAERASPEKVDHSEQASQTPSQEVCAWCARCAFFCARKEYVKAKSSGATRACSLCFIFYTKRMFMHKTQCDHPSLFVVFYLMIRFISFSINIVARISRK